MAAAGYSRDFAVRRAHRRRGTTIPSPHAAASHPDRLLDVLACPLCGGNLHRDGSSLRCVERHTFDIARHGYVSLLAGTGRPSSADTAAMVQARSSFLAADHYAPLADALARTVAGLCPPDGTVLDAGVGTGYYLAAVLDALPAATGAGLDTSTYALRRAARAHSRAGAASWDLWRPLPLRSGAFDLVLNVFAPRNGPEYRRVLRADGALVVVTPTPRHLGELRPHIGLLTVDSAKPERLRQALAGHFHDAHTEVHEYALGLTAQDVDNLVSMGPSAHHVDADDLRRRVARLADPFEATASFRVSTYRPRDLPD